MATRRNSAIKPRSLVRKVLASLAFLLASWGCQASNGRTAGMGGATLSPSGGTAGAGTRNGGSAVAAAGAGGTGASGGMSGAGTTQATGGSNTGSGGSRTAGGATGLAAGSGGDAGAAGTAGAGPATVGGQIGGGAAGQPASGGGRSGGNTGSTTAGSGGVATGGATKPSSTGGASGTGGGVPGDDGGTDDSSATIVPDPSWTCGMPDGIPSPKAGTLVFSITLTLGATHDVGNTQFGHRRQLDVKGGQVTGDRLQATVLSGGLDYELTLSNGATELEEINILRASDNTTIFMRNCGVAPAGESVVRIVPDIEAPTASALAWLNTAKLVGTRVVDAAGGHIDLAIYDVSAVSSSGAKIQLKDPAGVPNVSWDCVPASGSKGASVFTENVTLGSTVQVASGKRGSRNIIPITGGTTTGKVSGSILNGGADYQLAGTSGTTLDARYTLAPSDGEFIIVRNCGPMNALAPIFEARADGPYAFLTQNSYLSSAPGGGTGGVSITFYQRQ